MLTNDDILKMEDLPIVHNTISPELIDAIPETVDERREFILAQLGNITECVFSNGLQEYVALLPKSVVEISSHASKSVLSTIMALNCVSLISAAKVLETGIAPHSNKEKKVFHFKEIKLLGALLEGYGHAKITVGKQSLGKHLVYCVTGLEIENSPIESTPFTGPKQ